MRCPLRPRSMGFTVLELVVAIVILGMLSTGLYGLLHRTTESRDDHRLILEMQENARLSLHTLTEAFGQAGEDGMTQPSIAYAGQDSIVFVADADQAVPGEEEISYHLSAEGDRETANPFDTVLMKTVRSKEGNILHTAPQAHGIAPNGLGLKYFDGAGNELDRPVPRPELIREVELEVTVVSSFGNGESGYRDLTLSATISPGKRPHAPARSRPGPPSCGPVGAPERESLAWTPPTVNAGSPGPEALYCYDVHAGTWDGAIL